MEFLIGIVLGVLITFPRQKTDNKTKRSPVKPPPPPPPPRNH